MNRQRENNFLDVRTLGQVSLGPSCKGHRMSTDLRRGESPKTCPETLSRNTSMIVIPQFYYHMK